MGTAGVALSGSAAEKLAIDAAGAVRFGGDHMQPAELGHAASKFDVGPAAGHVGGHGDLPALARFGDDAGFLGGLSRVEHAMGKLKSGETPRNFF